MKWIVHLTVLLLNLLWVAFFLTDPLEVFVQKRSSSSSDEEMKVGEFCLQPPSDPMWTSSPGPADVSTDKTRTTSDANMKTTNTTNENHSVSRTPTEPNYLNSSQQSDIRAPTSAAQTPSTSSTIRDLNEATTDTPTIQTWTSSEATSVISNPTTEDFPIPATHCSRTLLAQGNVQNVRKYGMCCVAVSRVRIPMTDIKGYCSIMDRPSPCVQAILLITKSGTQICGDPLDKWTQRAMQFFDLLPKIRETSESERRASTVTDSETTTATIPPQILTSSEATSELELISESESESNSRSEAAPVTATESSKTPVTQRNVQNHKRCRCIALAKGVQMSLIKQVEYQKPTPWCPQRELILTIKSGQQICVDPDAKPFQRIIERIESQSKTEEASQSDRRVLTVADSETTTATQPSTTQRKYVVRDKGLGPL